MTDINETIIQRGHVSIGKQMTTQVDDFYNVSTTIPVILKCSGSGYEKVFREFINDSPLQNSTAKSYNYISSEFLNFCMYCLDVKSVQDIQFKHIQEYSQRNKALDKNTYRRSEFFIVRSLLEKFRDNGLINKLPLPKELDTFGQNRKFPKPKRKSIFIRGEHHALFDVIDEALETTTPKGTKAYRDTTLIAALLYSNIPAGKLLKAKGDDLRIDESGRHFLEEKRKSSYKYFRLSEKALAQIKQFIKQSYVTSGDEYIFQSLTKSHGPTGKRLQTGGANIIIKIFCEEQGIPVVTTQDLIKAKKYISKADARRELNDIFS